MASTSIISILKLAFLVLFVVILLANLAVNVMYNMTGYSGRYQMPGSSVVSSLTESIKQYGKPKTSSAVAGNQTLILTKVLEKVVRSEPQESVPTLNKNITITFYNLPDWTNIDGVNNVFQKQCVYSNCRMDIDLDKLVTKDAIIFSPHEPMSNYPPISPADRRADQVWIMFGYEAPTNFVDMGYRHNNWLNTVNWTMSYRMNADVFYSYGFLRPNPTPPTRDYSAIYREKKRQGAWIVSHCNAESGRDTYVNEIQEAGFEVTMVILYLYKMKLNKFVNHSSMSTNIIKNNCAVNKVLTRNRLGIYT